MSGPGGTGCVARTDRRTAEAGGDGLLAGDRRQPIGVTAKVYVRIDATPEPHTWQLAMKAGDQTGMRFLGGFIFGG